MGTDTKIQDARAVIEQSKSSGVALSSDQILTVIEQTHACYDYCATWKEPTQEEDRPEQAEDRADVTASPR